MGVSTAPYLDAQLSPSPKQVPTLQPRLAPPPTWQGPPTWPQPCPCPIQPPQLPEASSSARPHPLQGGHTQATLLPKERSNFLGRRRSGLSPYETLCPGPGAATIIFAGGGGILTADGVTPGFLHAYHLPSRYPQTTGSHPKYGLFNFPPRHIINKLLQLRRERRKSSNFEALGISKSRAKIQNKCSFMWSPPPFFSFCSFVKPRDPFRGKGSFLTASH